MLTAQQVKPTFPVGTMLLLSGIGTLFAFRTWVITCGYLNGRRLMKEGWLQGCPPATFAATYPAESRAAILATMPPEIAQAYN
jgi:hypothetical protein